MEITLVSRLCHFVECVGNRHLSWHVDDVVGGIGDNGAQSNQVLRSDRPAYFPAGAVQEFATTEDRDCPLPVVAHRGKAGVRQAVEGKEIIHFIGECDDLRAVVKDV